VMNIPQAHRTRANLYSGLSAALLEMNRLKESADTARQALASAEADPQANPLDIVNYACRLAAASSRMKDYALAESLLTQAHDKLAKLPSAESLEMGNLLHELGFLRYLQKRYNEAADFQGRALEIVTRYTSADHPQILTMRVEYASTLRKLKRKDEAERVEQEVRNATKLSPDDPGLKHSISVSDLRSR
jgi:tetratricopeptide (TPR) repeat protein